MIPAEFSLAVKKAARELGFDAVGVAGAERMPEGGALRRWLAAGHQAGMRWMENPAAREDPGFLLPGARSVVVTGLCCRTGCEPARGGGRIASFARFRDYHAAIGEMLESLLDLMRRMAPCRGVVAVDSLPLLERPLARRAGLGWIGGSSCLVSPEFGPWLLLGEIVTDAELAPDSPLEGRCGECTKCRDACPAGALVAPGVLDSGRCIAYLTVEHRGEIPPSLHGAIGDRLFGCDECLRACPWGMEAAVSRVLAEAVPAELDPEEVSAMGEVAFRERFSATTLMRAGRKRLARNAALIMKNSAGRAATGARR